MKVIDYTKAQGSILDKAGNWDGLIDDVRIFNRALSSEEIAKLAKLRVRFE